MNIYIDLGAYNGDTIKEFVKWKDISGKDNWKIYGFEPNPDVIDQIKGCNENIPNCHISNKAVWTYDGQIEFTVRPPKAPYGSTANQHKRDWGQGQIIMADCIDFSKWLTENVTEKDYVLIKCDLEGGEYETLGKVVDDGNADLVDLLMIEWHDSKVSNFKPEHRKKIEDGFKNLKVWT